MVSADVTTFVQLKIQPTLGPALTELARVKPADPVVWLANYLLANKPPPQLQAAGTAATMQALVDMFSSPEGKAELRALFDSCDKDGDGCVTAKEWGKAVGKHWKTMAKFFGGVDKKEVGKAFKSLDADGSGDLTWTEFEEAVEAMDVSLRLAAALETKAGSEELKALFDTLDKNGDGTVSKKEWGSAVKKNQEQLKKFFGGSNIKAIGKAFNRIDADGSGDLTWDEFKEGSQRIVQ